MKKTTLILFVFMTCPFFSLQSIASKNNYKDCTITLNDVNFTVDPRIELFNTMQVMAGIPLVNFIELDYKERIATRFAPHKSHPLFLYLKDRVLYGKLFKFIDAPMPFLLHMTSDLEWRKDIDVPEAKDPALDSLRRLMKDFSEQSNFPAFFNSNADFYQISLATVTYNLPNFDEKNRLLNYAGSTNGKNIQFHVILNFLGWGNFGPRIFKKNGAELYAIIAPEKTAIRVPTFDVSALYRLLWHEFAHSFANPAVEKVETQFNQFEWMWAPIKEPMKAQAYNSWQSVVKEHLTEAIACRMAALKFGESTADLNYVRRQYGMRWIYLHPLLSALKHYEKNRRQFPTLDSFIPEIIKAFKQVKRSDIDRWMAETDAIRKPDIDVMPTIGDIYSRKNILFIVSSNEPEKEADQQLKTFMEKFKNMSPELKDAKVVADTTALKMDLANYNLSVWGSAKGNKFLQKYLPQIPLLIEDDKVIAENIYEGRGYGVLIGWVNPLNLKNAMAIYTGQSPADVVDFNQIPNGGGNYHIFRNKVTLRQGNFSRQGLIWFAK